MNTQNDSRPLLVVRQMGGLGDILTHRLIFQALYEQFNDVHFACPSKYHDAVADHPYLSSVIDSDTLDVELARRQFNVKITTNICRQHEKQFPLSNRNRADIWAGWCGVRLVDPSMYLAFEPDDIERGLDILGPDKIALIAPVSANPIKDLLPSQVLPCVEWLQAHGYSVLGLHDTNIPWLASAGVRTLTGLSYGDWLRCIAAADFVLTTDSAAFHSAGGIGINCLGVFSWANGPVVAKYYPRASTVQVSRSIVPCCPCNVSYECPFEGLPKPCLASLGADQIVAAIGQRLGC